MEKHPLITWFENEIENLDKDDNNHFEEDKTYLLHLNFNNLDDKLISVIIRIGIPLESFLAVMPDDLTNDLMCALSFNSKNFEEEHFEQIAKKLLQLSKKGKKRQKILTYLFCEPKIPDKYASLADFTLVDLCNKGKCLRKTLHYIYYYIHASKIHGHKTRLVHKMILPKLIKEDADYMQIDINNSMIDSFQTT